MTPCRYLAASGPEREMRLREECWARPAGEGPAGAEARGVECEKARRWRHPGKVKIPGRLAADAALAEVKTLRAGCIVMLAQSVALRWMELFGLA
jgi:hypothetical protein